LSYRVGSAYITVRPDMSGFNDEVGDQVSALGGTAGAVEMPAEVDTADAAAALDDASQERDVQLDAQADTGTADAELDAAAAERTVPLIAEADTSEADADLDAAAAPREVVIGADDEDAKAKIADLQRQIAIAQLQAKDIEIGTDATASETQIAGLEAQLEELRQPEEIEIDSGKLSEATESAKTLGMTVAAIGAAPSLVGLVSILGGVGAGFAATAEAGGGLSAVTQSLEEDFRSGADGVSGFGAAVQQVGGSGLKDFSDAASLAGAGVGKLFEDLSPEIEAADKLVEDIAGDFSKWAQSVSGSGIESFFSKLFGGINVDELKSDLGDIATIIEHVGEAEQEMSPIAMGALSDVLNLLSHLPPEVITALTAMFLAIKGVGALSDMVQWASSVGDSIDKVKTKLSDLFGSGDDGAAEQAGAETGEAYAGGLEQSASVGDIGEETAADLAEGADTAEGAGEATGAAYAGGIAETAGDGAAGIGAIAGAELADGADTAAGAGAATGAAYAGGLAETAADGAGAAGDVVAAELAAGAGPAEEAGEMVGEGFAAGIAIAGAEAELEAADIAETVDATLATALEIESPSKRLMRRGVDTGLGFALGLSASIGDVQDAASSLAHAAVSELSGITSAQSLGALGAIGGGALSAEPGAMQISVSMGATDGELTNQIVKSLRFAIQGATGGDVQAHLGRGKVRT
jgi:hypothetical protein